MPVAIWSQEYETGIEAIDAQHKQLFEAINRLAGCFRVGNSGEGARETLEFLSEYTRGHFDTEEDFMRMVGYPERTSHELEHTELLTRVQNLIVKADEGFLITADVATFVADWLTHHIHEVDMGYVRFTRNRQSQLAD